MWCEHRTNKVCDGLDLEGRLLLLELIPLNQFHIHHIVDEAEEQGQLRYDQVDQLEHVRL